MALPPKIPRLAGIESSTSSSESDSDVEALDVGSSLSSSFGKAVDFSRLFVGAVPQEDTSLEVLQSGNSREENSSDPQSSGLCDVSQSSVSCGLPEETPSLHSFVKSSDQQHLQPGVSSLSEQLPFGHLLEEANAPAHPPLVFENQKIDVDFIATDFHEREDSDFEVDDGDVRLFGVPSEDFEDSDSEEDSTNDLSSTEAGASSTDAGKIPETRHLFPGSPISLEESLLAILSFSQSENLSGEGSSRLLKLIELLCPTPNNCCKSFEKLQNYFETFKTPTVSHFYCNICLNKLDSLTHACERCVSLKPSVDQIIVLSLEDQLSQMYSRPGFLDSIQYRFKRQKLHPDHIEDVYDGSVYRSEAESGLLREKNNVSLMWNTDGASPYDSSNLQVWPFFCIVNELPPNQRFKRENLLLAAVFVGKSKPETNIFLKHIYPQVEALKQGFYVKPHGFREAIQVQAVMLCGTCDSPAKAIVFNQKYHSGFYSCPKCLCKGEKSERTDDVLVHPYEENFQLRTELDYEEDALQAAVDNAGVPKYRRKAHHGVKGTTYLYLMVTKMLESTAIDTLHCLNLGVMKQLIELWFNKSHKREQFSLYKYRKVVSKRLESIRPPLFVKRLPQSLRDLSNWKAYEFMLMLYYYLLPILSEIMPQIYFHNFKLLVSGVSLLNGRSVSISDVRKAEELLKQFVKDFEELYSVRAMSFNIHLILHLAWVVECLGPTWCYSCYRFEDFNAKLLSFIHGSRHAGSQIASGIFTFLSLPRLVKIMDPGKAKDFCTQLANKWKRVKLNESINEAYFSVGKYFKLHDIPQWMSNVLQAYEFVSVFTFNRIKVRNMVITSERYAKCNVTCSKFVKYVHDGEEKYGLAKEFVKLSMCHCVKNCQCPGNFFAFVKLFDSHDGFQTANPPSSIKHIQQCIESQVVHFVPVTTIVNVCFYLPSENSHFLCDPLNDMEMFN